MSETKRIGILQNNGTDYDNLNIAASTVSVSQQEINQFLGNGNSVEDALNWLSNLGKYWWKKQKDVPNYSETTKYIYDNVIVRSQTVQENQTQKQWMDTGLTYGSSYFINSSTGKFDLNDSKSLQWYWYIDSDGDYNWQYNVTKANYVLSENKEYCYYNTRTGEIPLTISRGSSTGSGTEANPIKTTFEFVTKKSSNYPQVSITIQIDSYTTTKDFVFSSNPNAYPKDGTADSDGYKWYYLGQPLKDLPTLFDT